MAKRGLGRGLGAIFGEETVETAAEKRNNRKTTASSNTRKVSGSTDHGTENNSDVSRETLKIKLSLIEPNSEQPRKNFDEDSLNELAASIKEHGVIQPIIVKKNGQMYTIVVGERRWRAARIAGLKEIPAIVKVLNEKETAELALIENIQRENLSSVEEAKAFRTLLTEFEMTQEELAQRVSKNRSTITNSLRLLQLDDEILELIDNGDLSAGHARAILSINGKRLQYKAAREIINNGMSVRDAEKLAKRMNIAARKETDNKNGDGSEDDNRIYLEALEGELTESMKLKVNIRQKGKSRGKVEIEYSSADELEQIIFRIRAGQKGEELI